MIIRVILLIIYQAAFVRPESQAVQDYVEVKDHKIYYEISGMGQPVLLLHGGYLDHTMWDEQVKYLNDKGFMTIRFDDVGHGKSISGESELFSHEIIETLLSVNNIDKVSIVGLSWGTMMAMDYALKHPRKVDKLILISPGLKGWNYFKDEKAQRNYELRQLARKNENREMFVEYFQKNWTDGPGHDSLRIDPEIRERIGYMIRSNVANHWKANWSSIDDLPVISDLKPPTLIVTGTLDGKDIQMIGETLNREIGRSERIEIKDVAHTLNLEKPLRTNRLIKKFLTH